MSKWLSAVPPVCNICKKPFTEHFYDTRMPEPFGIWALICDHCFEMFDCRVGVGYGQKYRTSDLECVEGGYDNV